MLRAAGNRLQQSLRYAPLAPVRRTYSSKSGSSKSPPSNKYTTLYKGPTFAKIDKEPFALDEMFPDPAIGYGVMKGPELRVGSNKSNFLATAKAKATALKINPGQMLPSLEDISSLNSDNLDSFSLPKVLLLEGSLGVEHRPQGDGDRHRAALVGGQASLTGIPKLLLELSSADARTGKGHKLGLKGLRAAYAKLPASPEFTEEQRVFSQELAKNREEAGAMIYEQAIEQGTGPGGDGPDPLEISQLLDYHLNIRPSALEALSQRNDKYGSNFTVPLQEKDLTEL